MLSFFRKARKLMVKKGDLLKYIYYALGEVLIIIVGILLAVQINNFNERKTAKAEEQKILANLKVEFTENIKDIKNHMYSLRFIRSKGDSILYFINNPDKVNVASLNNCLGVLGSKGTLTPKVGITQSTISSGNLSLISDDSLRLFISSWPDWVKIISTNDNYHVDNLYHEYNPFLYKNFSLRNRYWEWINPEDQEFLGMSQHNFDLYNLLANKEFENIVVARNDILFDLLAASNMTFEKAEEIKERIEVNLD